MNFKKQRNIEVFWEWQIIGIVSSLILFAFAYRLQDAEWTKINGGVRILMHALAAMAAVYCIYFTVALLVVIVTQNMLERWLLIINIKRENRKIILGVERILLKVIRPMLGVILYIQFCYNWETLQAIEMNRGIQEEQLAVDIMFAIIMGFELLFRLSDKAAVCPYYWSKREVIDKYYDHILDWGYYIQDGGVIYSFCVRRLTPVIIGFLDYLIIWSMFFMIGH